MQTKNRDKSPNQPFFTDITELRRRAREHIDRGAVTPSYSIDPTQAVEVLNQALATEIVCTLRYTSHSFMAEGLQSKTIAEEFAQHAVEENQHAHQLASRIKQLGGHANFNPEGMLTRSHAEFTESDNLVGLIEENLVAERIAIESYGEMIQFFGDRDPVSRRMLEEILAKEDEHAEELSNLLLTLDPEHSAKTSGVVPSRDLDSTHQQHLPGHLRRIQGA